MDSGQWTVESLTPVTFQSPITGPPSPFCNLRFAICNPQLPAFALSIPCPPLPWLDAPASRFHNPPNQQTPPSSSGLGRQILSLHTGVRLPLGVYNSEAAHNTSCTAFHRNTLFHPLPAPAR